MLSLEPEVQALRAQLGDRAADALIARERREVFSVYPELRIAGWLGATLLAAAAGIFLKENLDRIGPLALSVITAVAAVACYAWSWWRRGRASVVDDYVLLLGALLVSADVAFIESQYHILDDSWKHHLLLLAIVHALGAHAYGSRMVLSLSIIALAGWFGVDRTGMSADLMRPAFLCALALILWREADRRLTATAFSRTFEHFAANIALVGALSELATNISRGALLTTVIAAGVIAWGFFTRSEPFVLYGFVYAVIGNVALLLDLYGWDGVGAAMVVTVALVVAILGLFALHALFRHREARR